MRCDYFEAAVCRSCHLLEIAYPTQLERKQARVAAALPPVAWLPAVASAESGFRNKAKMVAGGRRGAPTLGILGPDQHGVDLTACGLHSTGLQRALPVLESFVADAGLTPYDVPGRAGELKHVIVTESPAGELMVRFVLRSRAELHLIDVAALQALLPAVVVSANLQPEHKAILEGPEEVFLTAQEDLTMRINGIDLHLRPQSFFQTNTEVAAALYRHATELVAAMAPSSVWDLYCGVGGFGLHVATPGRSVLGVESSEQAIASARTTASSLGPVDTTWIAADATSWAVAQPAAPDLVIVNPPRRGIGPKLSTWLESSRAPHVVYSSCNVESLARDLALMPSLRPVSARLLDMFPHTEHHEVLLLLSRH